MITFGDEKLIFILILNFNICLNKYNILHKVYSSDTQVSYELSWKCVNEIFGNNYDYQLLHINNLNPCTNYILTTSYKLYNFISHNNCLKVWSSMKL